MHALSHSLPRSVVSSGLGWLNARGQQQARQEKREGMACPSSSHPSRALARPSQPSERWADEIDSSCNTRSPKASRLWAPAECGRWGGGLVGGGGIAVGLTCRRPDSSVYVCVCMCVLLSTDDLIIPSAARTGSSRRSPAEAGKQAGQLGPLSRHMSVR